MFSSRTNWHRQPNRLTEALEARRKSGQPIYDLTNSNPTDCGISYPEKEILAALSNPKSLRYQPDPRGLLTAREAIAHYCRERNTTVEPSDIFLTSSTSEAYSLVFKLLCNAGESVIIPSPSYPLFDYLAQVNDVAIGHYSLNYDHGWHIDVDSIEKTITETTKAIVLISPHNPTGTFLKEAEYNAIKILAAKHSLALIVDEVFADYGFDENSTRVRSTSGASGVLTFTLNGISKLAGLPQMKLGWITVSGEQRAKSEACERLEILNDTFLSVNTPVQVALPELMRSAKMIQTEILDRVKTNYRFIRQAVSDNTACSLLENEGGWYAILKVPRVLSDEEWTIQLLEKKGVYLFPGYFFDFQQEGYLIVGLLTTKEVFQPGIKAVFDYIGLQ